MMFFSMNIWSDVLLPDLKPACSGLSFSSSPFLILSIRMCLSILLGIDIKVMLLKKGHIVVSAVEQTVYRAPYGKAVDVWSANCMYWCLCITEHPMVRQWMCGLLTVCTGVCVLQSTLW